MIRYITVTGPRLKWSKTQFHWLHQDSPWQEGSELDLGGLKLHPKMESDEFSPHSMPNDICTHRGW